MIQVNLGKPAAQEKALSRLIASLSADDIYGLRKSIYQKRGSGGWGWAKRGGK